VCTRHRHVKLGKVVGGDWQTEGRNKTVLMVWVFLNTLKTCDSLLFYLSYDPMCTEKLTYQSGEFSKARRSSSGDFPHQDLCRSS